MERVFYVQAIRSAERFSPPVVVDWTVVRSAELGPVKRRARILADTATEATWNWPAAQAIRVVDENGVERFRCWCRIALRLPRQQQPAEQRRSSKSAPFACEHSGVAQVTDTASHLPEAA